VTPRSELHRLCFFVHNPIGGKMSISARKVDSERGSFAEFALDLQLTSAGKTSVYGQSFVEETHRIFTNSCVNAKPIPEPA
jgi:hypothetical protein